MLKLFQYVDEEALKAGLEEGLISERASEDGYLIYNYTNQAMYTAGSWNNPAVRKCRGLIVNPATQAVLARPWEKFFNHNQPEAGELDLNAPVEVTDKVDGSLGIIYLNSSNQPCVATRGSFSSEQAIWATQWIQENKVIPEKLIPLLKTFTLLVEIVYPENRIVVDYGSYEGLVLLGGVHIDSGEYYGPSRWKGLWGGDVTETLSFSTLKEALEAPPRPGKEGICVRYLNESKIVKVKQEDYVRLHRTIFNLSRKTVWEYLFNGGDPDLKGLLDGLPDEFIPWVEGVRDEILRAVEELTSEAERRLENIVEDLPYQYQRKDVAQRITAKENRLYAPLMFCILNESSPFPVAMKYIKSDFTGRDRVRVQDESVA